MSIIQLNFVPLLSYFNLITNFIQHHPKCRLFYSYGIAIYMFYIKASSTVRHIAYKLV